MGDVRQNLRTVVERFGPQVLADADGLRSLLDDMLEEDVSASEINLLVDAVRFGAVDRLRALVEHGADPSSAVVSAGGFLAEQRGATDERHAVWACATIGYALGLVREGAEAGAAPEAVATQPTTTSTWVGDPPATRPSPEPDTVDAPSSSPGQVRTHGRWPIALVAALAVLVVLGVTVAVALLREESARQPASAGTPAGPTTETATETASTPPSEPTATSATTQDDPATTTELTASAGGAATAAVPPAVAEAETLSDEAARQLLTVDAEEDSAGVLSLQGYWVPQVSSKCEGIPVDIEPGYVPDGIPDEQDVSAPQILALHLRLADRFGALTSLPSAAGIESDRPPEGACAGRLVWMSLVPVTYETAAGAIGWCDRYVPPVDECLARFVSLPGGESTAVERS